jgi:dCMP deaminase
MITRCTQISPSSKERYQGTIYENLDIEPSWLGPDGFAQFYQDVGPAPHPKMLLDREDNTKGYLKGNVRWVNTQLSNENKSNVRFLTVLGETKSIQEWADDLGISNTGLTQRLDVLGWTPEQAVTLPPERGRPVNDGYFLSIAGRVALRGNCARRQVGCVLVDDHARVIATAYNSVPAGIEHCTLHPCLGAKEAPGTRPSNCQAKHAEELALIKCPDVFKIKTCYVTASPCLLCVRRLIDTSCTSIVFAEEYPDQAGKLLWTSQGGRSWYAYNA